MHRWCFDEFNGLGSISSTRNYMEQEHETRTVLATKTVPLDNETCCDHIVCPTRCHEICRRTIQFDKYMKKRAFCNGLETSIGELRQKTVKRRNVCFE